MKTPETGDDLAQLALSIELNENLPIPPSTVLQHPLHQPGGMPIRINAGSVDIPEKMGRQMFHAASLRILPCLAKNESEKWG